MQKRLLVILLFLISIVDSSIAREKEISSLKSWIDAIESVKNLDAKLDGIASFITTNYYFAILEKDKIIITSKDKADNNIGLLFIQKESAKESTRWKNIWEKHPPFYFNPDARCPLIVIKNIPVSDTWKKIILFQEGSYAMLFLLRTFDDVSLLNKKTLENYYVYSHQAILLEKLGGKKYLKLLDNEAEKVAKNYPKIKQLDVNFCQKKLEDIFGKSLSPEEDNIRYNSFFVNLILKGIEKKYGNNNVGEKEKLLFFRNFVQ